MLITTRSLPRLLVAFVAAATLGACATRDGGTDHVTHHQGQRAGSSAAGAAPSGSAAMGSGMMGGTQAGGPAMAGQMDKAAMCAAHREMQNATTEQRQAMMEQHMKGMSPEMRQQHMEMMQQQCK